MLYKKQNSSTNTGKNRGHLKEASCLLLCLSTLCLLHTYSHTHLCTGYFIAVISYIYVLPKRKRILFWFMTSLYTEYTAHSNGSFVHWTRYSLAYLYFSCIFNNMQAYIYVLVYSHKSLRSDIVTSQEGQRTYLWAMDFITHSLEWFRGFVAHWDVLVPFITELI